MYESQHKLVLFYNSHPNTWLIYLIPCSIHGNGSSYKHFLFQKDENWRFEFKIIIYSFLTIPQQWMWKNNVQQNSRAFLVSKRT